MANFITVSGSSNIFHALYWMHGSATGGASDVTAWTISGSRNVFNLCSPAGPMDATQAASANYAGVVLSGSLNHFKDCAFGAANALRRTTASTNLKISGGSWNVFENCTFFMGAAAATPYFINVSDAGVTGSVFRAIFLNCRFLNAGRADIYKLTVGIQMTPAYTTENHLFFDNRCTMYGVTDIVAAANEGQIIWGGAGASPDSVAIGDDLNLGIAQYVKHT